VQKARRDQTMVQARSDRGPKVAKVEISAK
jgi:hypothetical protein